MQNFRALGAPSPDPQNSPLIANSGYAPAFVTVAFVTLFISIFDRITQIAVIYDTGNPYSVLHPHGILRGESKGKTTNYDCGFHPSLKWPRKPSGSQRITKQCAAAAFQVS